MASNNDMKAHKETYSGVMSFLKWGTIVSALTAVLVIILIAG
jgi:Bacterial aa3 type cytochrome c oxidase subunit IV